MEHPRFYLDRIDSIPCDLDRNGRNEFLRRRGDLFQSLEDSLFGHVRQRDLRGRYLSIVERAQVSEHDL